MKQAITRPPILRRDDEPAALLAGSSFLTAGMVMGTCFQSMPLSGLGACQDRGHPGVDR
jgi:hypothetical protein